MVAAARIGLHGHAGNITTAALGEHEGEAVVVMSEDAFGDHGQGAFIGEGLDWQGDPQGHVVLGRRLRGQHEIGADA